MTEHEADGVTVGAAAELVGVTVRTLHHWDEIELAVPSGRTHAGYRLYTSDDLDRLQRIVAYREAGLGLGAIKAVLDDDIAEIPTMLRAQRDQLARRIDDLRRLDGRLERMVEAHERGILLDDAEQADVFGDDWDPDDATQARALWGGTAQWAQFAERSSARTRDEWQALSQALSGFEREAGAAMAAGVRPDDPEAEALVDRHRELFSHVFTLTREMQVCLWRMFESDAGFSAYYDRVHPGLTAWFREAVDVSARNHGIDPETAVWR